MKAKKLETEEERRTRLDKNKMQNKANYDKMDEAAQEERRTKLRAYVAKA